MGREWKSLFLTIVVDMFEVVFHCVLKNHVLFPLLLLCRISAFTTKRHPVCDQRHYFGGTLPFVCLMVSVVVGLGVRNAVTKSSDRQSGQVCCIVYEPDSQSFYYSD